MLRERASEPRRPKVKQAPRKENDSSSWWHEPNPWVLGIGTGVVVAVLGALVGLLVSG